MSKSTHRFKKKKTLAASLLVFMHLLLCYQWMCISVLYKNLFSENKSGEPCYSIHTFIFHTFICVIRSLSIGVWHKLSQYNQAKEKIPKPLYLRVVIHKAIIASICCLRFVTRQTRCSSPSTMMDLWFKMSYSSLAVVCVLDRQDVLQPLQWQICGQSFTARVCACLSVMDQLWVDMMSNRSVVQAPTNHVASGLHALCICKAN